MPLRPVVFEQVIGDENDQTIDELVTVFRDHGKFTDWLAMVASGTEGERHPGVVGAGESPEAAVHDLARVLRKIADKLDPLSPRFTEMMLGLVRCAEFKEQEENGRIWDDSCRKALDIARALGWGRHKVGILRAERIEQEE